MQSPADLEEGQDQTKLGRGRYTACTTRFRAAALRYLTLALWALTLGFAYLAWDFGVEWHEYLGKEELTARQEEWAAQIHPLLVGCGVAYVVSQVGALITQVLYAAQLSGTFEEHVCLVILISHIALTAVFGTVGLVVLHFLSLEPSGAWTPLVAALASSASFGIILFVILAITDSDKGRKAKGPSTD